MMYNTLYMWFQMVATNSQASKVQGKVKADVGQEEVRVFYFTLRRMF